MNKWKQQGKTIAGGNGKGDQLNQVINPEGIFIDKKNNILIGDWRNDRIMTWKLNEKAGEIAAGGNGQGNRIDQLKWPTDVIVDEENNSLIIADFGNRRVVRWWNTNQQEKFLLRISDVEI